MQSARARVLAELVADMDEDITQSYLPEAPAQEEPAPADDGAALSPDDLSAVDAALAELG